MLSYGFKRWAAMAVGGLILGFAGLGVSFAAGPGPEVCANCHQDYVNSYAKSTHAQKGNLASAANAGECAACHGDVTEHVKDPMKVKPANLVKRGASADEKSGVCLACHAGQRQFAFWQSGQHRKADVSCNDCHSIHGSQEGVNDKMLKVKTPAAAPYTTTTRNLAYKTCIGCHRDQRAEILKPSHHPIVEGKVACHDCHDPHGALTPVMLKAESYQDLCTSCHADKRGPWIHEHPPVMENCATCHTPHGSSHNRLLAQKPPALCADCHPGGHTHGLYDGRGTLPGTLPSNIRFEGSGCVNCHRQIHGSNAPPSAFGQFFLR
jgi:DmsE family decaheme c-type cytochrome